ncbi:MAG: amidohydrolase family protein [Gemmatimonadota bacterium]
MSAVAGIVRYRPVLRAALLGALLLPSCRPTEKDRIALVGATVIDGRGVHPLPDQVVVVYHGKIETITAREGFEIPKTAVQLDVRGRWIIPGLIDAHAHTARWSLTRYLSFGVTTVRDVHGQQDSILALREQANLAGVLSPRIFSAGAMIDGVPATYPDATPVSTEDEARRAVDQKAVAGVDYLKIYTKVTPNLLRAIMDEAASFHLRVTAHLGLTDAVTAANLGVRGIEHMSGVPEAASRDATKFYAAHREGFFKGWTFFERSWAGLDSAALDRVAKQLAEYRVIVIPTLVLHDTFSRLDDPAVLNNPELHAVPDSELTRWNVPGMVARAGWTEADYLAFRAARPVQDLFLREFRSAGGMIAAGTDAANQLLVPGASEQRELELLVDAGLTPSDALAAATRNGAILLGADSLGILAPGKAADLVVLGGDPLADIHNIRKVERVMVRGFIVSADSLRAAW